MPHRLTHAVDVWYVDDGGQGDAVRASARSTKGPKQNRNSTPDLRCGVVSAVANRFAVELRTGVVEGNAHHIEQVLQQVDGNRQRKNTGGMPHQKSVGDCCLTSVRPEDTHCRLLGNAQAVDVSLVARVVHLCTRMHSVRQSVSLEGADGWSQAQRAVGRRRPAHAF